MSDSKRDPEIEAIRERQLASWRDIVRHVEDCDPQVVCLLAVGRSGHVRSILLLEDSSTNETYQAVGRLHRMAVDLAAMAAATEGPGTIHVRNDGREPPPGDLS